jgi:hypothetical protein
VSEERPLGPVAWKTRRFVAAADRWGLRHRVKPFIVAALGALRIQHDLTLDPAVFRELPRLRPTSPPKAGGPRVLVLSFRGGWLVHALWEVLIAEALRRRGATPTVFVCSGGIPEALPERAPACGISNIHRTRPLSCIDCLRCSLTMTKALNLPVLRLDDLMARPRTREVFRRAAGLDLDELLGLTHNGLSLGPAIRRSARWFLCSSKLDGSKESLAVVRGFAQTALLLAEIAPVLLDRVSPEVIFLLNGLFVVEEIIRAEALRRGIRVVTYEHGLDNDSVIVASGVAPRYDLDPLWTTISERPLSAAQDRRLTAYMNERQRGVWPQFTQSDAGIGRSLKLDPHLPTVALFTNVTFDTAVQDRDRGFRDMLSWVEESIRLFATWPDVQLVIRVHPGEVGLPGWATRDPVVPQLEELFPSLPPNVRIVPPQSDLSSYALIHLARAGLVYTSTIGLEMAMEGVPVVVAANVHYAGKGFTLDSLGPLDYPQLVLAALRRQRDPSIRERARRYGYAFFFRGNHPFPLVSEHPPDYIPTLNTANPSSLEPGGDPTLELLCSAILTGCDFYGAE